MGLRKSRLFRLGSTCCCISLLLAVAGSAQPIFEDITEQAVVPSGVPLVANNSTAFGDYDNDGWPDLFMTSGPLPTLLHSEGNGRFADGLATIQAEISPQNKGGGSIFADYDNDGDLDLYMTVGRFTPDADRDVLLRNDRGVFHDVGLAAGLDQGLSSDNAVWLDYDRDGYLDLYVANIFFGNRNKFYRNQGDGTFADVTAAVGLDMQLGEWPGGSNGGLAAGDYNNDGWPDLYVGVYRAPNRLFLHDGESAFIEATTDEIADEGESFSVAAGDIDNDGDLDIFQASGGGGNEGFRNLMLMNLGNGEFLDITEGVGLVSLARTSALTASLADIDNDGDLDLLTGAPHSLFLNRGDGTFEDHTDLSGMPPGAGGGALGDYDLDGFLDFVDGFGVGSSGTRLYRNRGNNHHWLRVELVGLESNRNGIGARLIATTGDRQQMRELLGGWGFSQDELVVHFGLGQSRQVDALEIRWPSGQVDIIENILADQKIRVFEGRNLYHKMEASQWVSFNLPAATVVGAAFDLDLVVQPSLFEPEAQITGVTADLSALGGPQSVPLVARADGNYGLQQSVKIPAPNGLKTLSILIEQNTFMGPQWVRLERTLQVFPKGHEDLLGAGAIEPWPIVLDQGDVPEVELYEGAEAVALENPVEAVLRTEQGVPLFGYQALRFRFHPGEASLLPRPNGAAASDMIYLSQAGDDIQFTGKSEVFAMRADGTRSVNLSNDPGEESLIDSDGPSWSPDGTKIAFTSRRGDEVDIYTMDADGSNVVRLTRHPAFDGGPAWSPNGQRIAFSSDRDSPEPFSGDPDNPSFFYRVGGAFTDADIYVMDVDGSNVVRLTDAPGLDHFASWSPDGTKIAFTSSRDTDSETGEPNREVYVMVADGSNAIRLTHHPAFDSEPSWSPDGRRIAFDTWSTSGLAVHVMNADGSNIIQLTDELGAGRPAWSPVAASTYMHFGVAVNGQIIRLVARDLADIGVDMERREWQEVEIPLAAFGLKEPIEEVRFFGDLAGTVHLNDIQLVAQKPSTASTTAVLEDYQLALPQSFALAQNFPNPFNSTTVIRFALPQSQEVELSIYNLAGQKVAMVVGGMRQAGSYSINWDGLDDAGHALASGVYFYLLRAGDRQEARKLLLLR